MIKQGEYKLIPQERYFDTEFVIYDSTLVTTTMGGNFYIQEIIFQTHCPVFTTGTLNWLLINYGNIQMKLLVPLGNNIIKLKFETVWHIDGTITLQYSRLNDAATINNYGEFSIIGFRDNI